LSSADILRTRGEGVSSDEDDLTFWRKKWDFSKFMVCPPGQEEGGVEPAHTRKRDQFLQFCADIFYGRPLSSLKVCFNYELLLFPMLCYFPPYCRFREKIILNLFNDLNIARKEGQEIKLTL